jgi:hypothetical protein
MRKGQGTNQSHHESKPTPQTSPPQPIYHSSTSLLFLPSSLLCLIGRGFCAVRRRRGGRRGGLICILLGVGGLCVSMECGGRGGGLTDGLFTRTKPDYVTLTLAFLSSCLWRRQSGTSTSTGGSRKPTTQYRENSAQALYTRLGTSVYV